jgi:hypothetical protein
MKPRSAGHLERSLAGLFGVAIYLSIRFTSGRFDSTRLPDVVLVGASALSLCFVPWADLIDGSALVVYALILLSIRLFVLKRSFRSPETVLYLALLYISLSRLDKVEGYGHPNQFLVIAQYLFLACIVSSCIYLVSKNANREAILALALLMFPVSHLPLELLRNAVARHLTEHVSHLYVDVQPIHQHGRCAMKPRSAGYVRRWRAQPISVR